LQIHWLTSQYQLSFYSSYSSSTLPKVQV